MIPNDQPLRGMMIKRMINCLANSIRNDSLTEWEQDFIESIHEQFQERGDLTTKQCEILERLYDK